LPLGNLTSQLLVNIYLNEFDQFVKHKLRVKYYVRYADDFVLLSENKQYLENFLPEISQFLWVTLRLSLNLSKVSIKTLDSGVDFLGWVHFPDHLILRPATRRRMFNNVLSSSKIATRISYEGLLKHGNTFKIRQKLLPHPCFVGTL